MKTRLLSSVIVSAFASFVMGQEIMYIEYKDGRSIKEELVNVDKISFHHLEELPADSIISDISRGLVAYYTFDNQNADDTI